MLKAGPEGPGGGAGGAALAEEGLASDEADGGSDGDESESDNDDADEPTDAARDAADLAAATTLNATPWRQYHAVFEAGKADAALLKKDANGVMPAGALLRGGAVLLRACAAMWQRLTTLRSTGPETDALKAKLQAAVDDSQAYHEALESGLLLVGKLVAKCPNGEQRFNHARARKAATDKKLATKPITAHADVASAGKVRACLQPRGRASNSPAPACSCSTRPRASVAACGATKSRRCSLRARSSASPAFQFLRILAKRCESRVFTSEFCASPTQTLTSPLQNKNSETLQALNHEEELKVWQRRLPPPCVAPL